MAYGKDQKIQKFMKKDIVIIGAGLTGLTLNYLIKKNTFLSSIYNIKIIEGRSRTGGRIHTIKKAKVDHTIEMGATWFGLKHNRFLSLLKELEIQYFEQTIGKKAHYEPLSTSPPYLVDLPPNPEPSMRLQGGTEIIIENLSQHILTKDLQLNTIVKSIKKVGSSLSINTDRANYNADIVISTLPPNLFASTIKVYPKLPAAFTSIAMATHTWMGESIKIALTFEEPFWRNKNGSGTIFSNVGPIPEMYDHCNYKDDFYALKGFFNGTYFSLSKKERLQKVLKQLEKYFGVKVYDYLSYEEAVWRKEHLTFIPYASHILPHQNNGHEVYHKSYLDNTLIIGGTETAKQFPGYMEGAVRSAESIVEQLLHQNKDN